MFAYGTFQKRFRCARRPLHTAGGRKGKTMKRSTMLGLGAAIFLSAYGSAFAQSDGEFARVGIQITLSEIEMGRLADANAARDDLGSYEQLLVPAQAMPCDCPLAHQKLCEMEANRFSQL